MLNFETYLWHKHYHVPEPVVDNDGYVWDKDEDPLDVEDRICRKYSIRGYLYEQDIEAVKRGGNRWMRKVLSSVPVTFGGPKHRLLYHSSTRIPHKDPTLEWLHDMTTMEFIYRGSSSYPLVYAVEAENLVAFTPTICAAANIGMYQAVGLVRIFTFNPRSSAERLHVDVDGCSIAQPPTRTWRNGKTVTPYPTLLMEWDMD